MVVTTEDIRAIVEKTESMADMETLKNDIPLIEQDIDSLDMANILLLLEEKYNVKIPDKDLSQIQSIDTIIDYLSTK